MKTTFVQKLKGKMMTERKTIYLNDALEAIRKLPNAGIHWFVSAEAVFDALLKLPLAEPEPTERTYKRGYADGYHKAEKDYFERTAKDRKDAFKAGLEIGEWQRETGRWETTLDLEREWVICSECGHQQWDKTNYCSRCGADMREVNQSV